MQPLLDGDVAVAAVDLVGRTGATEIQVGYLHDAVPAVEADWYAHAQYRGARIIVEHYPGPVEAVEALARRLLTGACCTCGKLVALSSAGAVFYPGARLVDGSSFTRAQARQGQCRWTRQGRTWVGACGAGVEKASYA